MRNLLSRPFLFVLNDASIRIKVLIAPAILILSLLLIAGMAIYRLNAQAAALKQANDIALDRITLISQFALLSEQVQSDIYIIAVLHSMELPHAEIQTIEDRLAQSVSDMKIMYGEIATTWPLDDTEHAILAEMKAPMDGFLLQGKKVVMVVEKAPSFGVLMIRSSTLMFSTFRESLSKLLDYQYDKISRTQAETVRNRDTLVRIIIGYVLLMAAAGVLISLRTSDQLITLPIQATTLIMSRLADNDLQIEVQGMDRKDEIGAMARAVEVFRANAVEKARLDKELQESQERLLMAQSVAHVGNWELDIASNQIWASVEAFRIYGLQRTSPYLSLEQVQKVPVSKDRPRLDAALKSLLRDQAPYNEEFSIIRASDQEERAIHSLANLVYDNNGIPEKVVGVIQDITSRKRAEDALRESEEKFSKAFQTSSYAIVITKFDDGGFVDVNEGFTALFGYTREEAIASSSIELQMWADPEDRNSVVSMLRSGRVVNGIEISFCKKNGELMAGLFSAQTIQLKQSPCILSSIMDVTERKRMEEKLKGFSTELERSNQDLEQFASIASHDLQEPLRMVTSYLNLLNNRYADELGDDAREFIHFAADGARRMKALIDDLLAYSRVGTRGKEFVLTECEVVLNTVIQNLAVAIKESKAEITRDPLPSVMVDEVQMMQLFQNLLGNAIKFRREAPPKVHVGVRTVKGLNGEAFWEFSVKDNGIGIKPQDFERVFVIFQRLQNKETYSGTGIGLAICKKIVERHGGRIWVESRPDHGSTFYFTIKALE